MPLPGSMFALDIEGGTSRTPVSVFPTVTRDRPCMPIPGHAGSRAVGQGWSRPGPTHHARARWTPFFGDPRHLLSNVLARFARLSLTPGGRDRIRVLPGRCRGRDAQGQPRPPRGPLTGRREFRTQINSMADLNDYSALLAEIDRVCRLQDVPTTSCAREYGPGTIRSESRTRVRTRCAPADQALRFKRAVKSVARAQAVRPRSCPSPIATWPAAACTFM
jgi:glutamine synthetase